MGLPIKNSEGKICLVFLSVNVCVGSQESASSVFLSCSPSYFQRQHGPLKPAQGLAGLAGRNHAPPHPPGPSEPASQALCTCHPGQDSDWLLECYKESQSVYQAALLTLPLLLCFVSPVYVAIVYISFQIVPKSFLHPAPTL